MRITQTVLSVLMALSISLSHAEGTSDQLISKQVIKKEDSFASENLKYTSADIYRIKKQKNIKYIIAAAHQMEYDANSDSLNFMKPYLQDMQKYPSGFSLYVNYMVRSPKVDNNHADKETERLLQKFIDIVPENGYAYYLAAYYYCDIKDIEKCLEYTEKAVNAKFFDNYWKELSGYLIETSVFLGYAKSVAHRQALPLSHYQIMYKKISDYITTKQPTVKNILLIKKMGELLYDSSSTVLEGLISLSIRKDSIKNIHDKKYEKELEGIEKERNMIVSCMKYLNYAGNNPAISEKRWEQYGDDLFQHSELYAIKKLMADYPNPEAEK